jgi:arabinan endo-1,5-alpha-L-arabinosidase
VKICICIALVSVACLLSGCGSGGSSSGATGGGSSTTIDMGSSATVDDTYQYTLTNASSGMVLGISSQSQTAGASVVQEASSSTTTTDIDWHFIPMGSSEYNLENMLTHQVLGISSASTSAGAQAVQYSDNGTNDHLWKFYLLSDGNYLIKNVNSGYFLEDANASTSTSATIDQGERSQPSTGGSYQEWKLTSTATAAYPAPLTVSVSYSSADSDTKAIGIHDPSMVKAGSTYYLYSTHGLLHAHESNDRTTFSDAGYALSTLPSWTNTYTDSSSDLWAPDISYHSSATYPYWLYYAASTSGSTNSAIGLAYSTTGAPGSFSDYGAAIYKSSNCSGANAIDPSSIVDASGNAWMVFGSWSNGIEIVQVDSSTGIPLPSSSCTQLAYHSSGTGIEGSYILYHNSYYYLFVSIDTCCEADSSTYRIAVGRSTAVNGPYSDRGGVLMTAGGGTILLSAHGTINGPGGETVLSDTDGDILVYHYYDGNNNGDPALGLNVLGWTSDDWPYIK